jgi:predicted transcriptional regulator
MVDDTVIQDEKAGDLIGLTAQIVSAYVGKNTVAQTELGGLIAEVHGALKRAADGGEVDAGPELRPAVPIKKSVFPDYIICLEDGKKFKSLKRHLRTHYRLTPDEYRAKWNLAHDYPMVAPNYAAARSQLARRMGLGTKRGAE